MSTSLTVGGFDLSVGSTASLANALVTSLFVWYGMDTTGAIVIALALCTLVGLVQCLPDYDSGGGDDLFWRLNHGKHGAAERRNGAEGTIPAAFSLLGQVPTIVIIMLVVKVVVQLALTKHGRRMYALGGNPEAARLSGTRTTHYRVLAYVIASLLAGLGGILLAGQCRRRLSDGCRGGVDRLFAGGLG